MTKKVINCCGSPWAPCGGSEMTGKWKRWQRVSTCSRVVVHPANENENPAKGPNWRKVIHFAFLVDEASYFIKVTHFMADGTDLKAVTFELFTRNEAHTVCKWELVVRFKFKSIRESESVRSYGEVKWHVHCKACSLLMSLYYRCYTDFLNMGLTLHN